MMPGYIVRKDGVQEVRSVEFSQVNDPKSFDADVAVGPMEILASLEKQVIDIYREPLSPAESKLVNALAVLIAVVRHIHGPQPGDRKGPDAVDLSGKTYTVR